METVAEEQVYTPRYIPSGDFDHDIEHWFAYETYRPNQRDMLRFVYDTVKNGEIGIIDAPTGSGKSSVISAILAENPNRRVLVAVRTTSQLGIFAKELENIRRTRQPDLKYAYIIGKGKSCPMSGFINGNIYDECDALKTISKEWHGRGVGVYEGCPYYNKIVNCCDGTPRSHDLAEQLTSTYVNPDNIREFCGDVCPYEVMTTAGKMSSVVIVNYHHIFASRVRSSLYSTLEILDTDEVVVIIDEAHNCGDVIEGINSISTNNRVVGDALTEVNMHGKVLYGSEYLRNEEQKITNFIDSIGKYMVREKARDTGKYGKVDIFDANEFAEYMMVRMNYESVDDLCSDCVNITTELMSAVEEYQRNEEKVRGSDKPMKHVIDVLTFIGRALVYRDDKSYLKVIDTTEENGRKAEIVMKLQNIDPSIPLSKVVGRNKSTILMSGTISPTDKYAKHLFADKHVNTFTLPFSFPKENRVVVCGCDVTTAFRERDNEVNTEDTYTYIREFAALPCNNAIFFPSYRLMNKYAKLMEDDGLKNVYVEPKDAVLAFSLLKEFMALPSHGEWGTMLGVCGGKWSEGIDYTGDTLRGSMIVGLPLAQWDAVTKARIEYYVEKFGKQDGNFIAYTLPALNKTQQALGRVLRAEDDKGVLILCDERYVFNRPVNGGLSPWIRKEMDVIEVKNIPKIVEKVRNKLFRWV